MLNRRYDSHKVTFHDIAIINKLASLYFLFISYLNFKYLIKYFNNKYSYRRYI